MKEFYTNIKKIAGLAALSVLMVAGVASCDFTGLTDTIDEFGVVVELEPINTSATVLLYDAVDGELITNNVTITYSGDYGDDVIDAYSDPISSSTVSDGILGFGINNAVTPSESSPASIRLIAEANGYITKSKTIHLTETGKNEFEIEMVRENNKPEGVETTTNSEGQADKSGSVQQDFTLESTADDDADSGSSVEVTAGTVFQDESGNALTGQLTSSMTYYNPNEPSAMSSIPVDMTDEEGNTVPIFGGASLEIRDGNGRRASSATATTGNKSQNGQLTFVIKLSNVSGNYKTPQDGDEIDVRYWDNSYSPYKTTGTVQVMESGQIQVRYSADFVPVYAFVSADEYLNRIDRTFIIENYGHVGSPKLGIQTDGYFVLENFKYNSILNFTRTPNNISYYVQNTIVIFTGNDIGSEEITITLPPPEANTINAEINVDLVCSNGGKISTTDLPATSVLYRRVDSHTRWATASNINFRTNEKGTALEGGTFNVTNVVQGADYDFKVNFDGDTYNKVITITGTTVNTEYEIDDNNVCTN